MTCLFPILRFLNMELVIELLIASGFTAEGSKAELAEFGYSRDKIPDKLQINFGIATGINGIPTALTIQKGNVHDKKHCY